MTTRARWPIICASLILPLWVHAQDTSVNDNRHALHEVWVNPGFYSYHFDHERNLENNNYGLGVEYRYSATQSVMAGRFHNSDRTMSNYAVWLWQPLSWGNIRLGALAGFIDGYPRANKGGWFPMAIPVASYEYKNMGINITAVPTIPNALYGSITLQLKLRLF